MSPESYVGWTKQVWRELIGGDVDSIKVGMRQRRCHLRNPDTVNRQVQESIHFWINRCIPGTCAQIGDT